MNNSRRPDNTQPRGIDSQFETDEVRRFVEILREKMPELRDRYNVKSLEVFGSYVRGEQEHESDLDLLVEFRETPTFFEFIRLEHFLSELLGVKVDLVVKDALKPAIGRHIREEAVPIR